MIYRITWSALLLFLQLVLWRRVYGAGRVPKTGAVILASNHISSLDPPVVCTGFWRQCAFMAKEELFENKAFGWFLHRLNAFSIKRGAGDRAAMRAAIAALEGGWPLVMFPEGTRSEDGELQAPELGVAMLAYRTGAVVVPVYLHNTHRVMPKGGGFRWTRIGVAYGEPMTFAMPEGQKASRAQYESASAAIMAGIARLRDETGWR